MSWIDKMTRIQGTTLQSLRQRMEKIPGMWAPTDGMRSEDAMAQIVIGLAARQDRQMALLIAVMTTTVNREECMDGKLRGSMPLMDLIIDPPYGANAIEQASSIDARVRQLAPHSELTPEMGMLVPVWVACLFRALTSPVVFSRAVEWCNRGATHDAVLERAAALLSAHALGGVEALLALVGEKP